VNDLSQTTSDANSAILTKNYPSCQPGCSVDVNTKTTALLYQDSEFQIQSNNFKLSDTIYALINTPSSGVDLTVIQVTFSVVDSNSQIVLIPDTNLTDFTVLSKNTSSVRSRFTLSAATSFFSGNNNLDKAVPKYVIKFVTRIKYTGRRELQELQQLDLDFTRRALQNVATFNVSLSEMNVQLAWTRKQAESDSGFDTKSIVLIAVLVPCGLIFLGWLVYFLRSKRKNTSNENSPQQELPPQVEQNYQNATKYEQALQSEGNKF
jgi:hypothetical protein